MASPGAGGTCPSCGAALVPKCGSIVSWHWAHKASDCDHWSEPESQWHIDWKQLFPKAWQEVSFGPHRADVGTRNGIIEFQRSSISADEIAERERFYGKMIWVVWAGDWCLEDYVTWHYRKASQHLPEQDFFGCYHKPGTEEHLRHVSIEMAHAKAWERARQMQQARPHYKWSPPRKSWFAARKPLFLDFGSSTLERVQKIYANGPPFYMTCKRIDKKHLIEHWSNYLGQAPST